MQNRVAALFQHAVLRRDGEAAARATGNPLAPPLPLRRPPGAPDGIAGKPSLERARAVRLNSAPHTQRNGRREYHECCAPTGRFCLCRSLECLDPFCERTLSAFAAHGSGLTAYFKGLKLLAWAFFLASVCAVPQLLININSRGPLSSLSALTLSATTLGNLGLPLVQQQQQQQPLLPPSSANGTAAASNATVLAQLSIPGWSLVSPGAPPTAASIALIYSLCDLAASLVLLFAFLYLRVGELREENQVNRATITADDYTVFLPNVPAHATERSLQAFFAGFVERQAPRLRNTPRDFGAVEEVHVVEDDAELLKLLLERGKRRRQCERAAEALRQALEEEAALARGGGGRGGGCCSSPASRARAARAKKAALDAQIDALTLQARAHKHAHEPSPVAAFVTFRHQAARDFVVGAYRGGWVAWCCQPRSHRLPLPPGAPPAGACSCRTRLRVKRAPAPNAILWANLQVPCGEHAVRVALTSGVALALLAVSFCALWFASARVAAAQAGAALAACTPALPTPPLAALLTPFSPAVAALRAAPAGAANATTFCACAAMPWQGYSLEQLQAPYSQRGLLEAADCPNQACVRWLELDVAGVWAQPFCVAWLQARSYAAALVVAAAALVLGVNSGLGWAMRRLTAWEGHHSVEDENASLAVRLFAASFFNTGLLVVMINVAWPLAQARELFPAGKYADFSPEWFDNVGSSLLITMLINVVSPHAYTVVMGCLYCRYVARSDLTAATQRDLNRRVAPPANDAAIRYAQLFTTIFVCLVFSTGLPLMMPILTVSLVLFYWVDKIAFMWYYRRPPAISVHLQQAMSALLPLALLLHLAVGCWMLSASALFQAVNVPLLRAYSEPVVSQLLALSAYPTVSRGVERLSQQGVLPILVLLVLVAAWMAAQLALLVLRRALGSLWALATCGQCRDGLGYGAGREWDLAPPTYLDSLDRGPSSGSRGRAQKMQGTESYNMLLDPQIMHAFGISAEWARSHRQADLVSLSSSSLSATTATIANPLGPASASAPAGGPSLDSSLDDEEEVEDALDDDDEGATVGAPRSYAISARRLGVPPSGQRGAGASGASAL